jgi:hypothetical protein
MSPTRARFTSRSSTASSWDAGVIT